MENMQEICDRLLWILEATPGGVDVVSLEYDEDSETVIATHKNGHQEHINVAAYSGMAMIHDILHNINWFEYREEKQDG